MTRAVLSQESLEDDKWHPVAYYSKSLSAVEWNYKIHDKEMLAVIQALEDWRHFLEGAHHKVEIWTDHKNLEYFMTAKRLYHHQAQWSIYLSRFNFSMHHRLGRSIGKSDALSHRADHGTRAGDNSNVTLLRPEFFTAHTVRALSGLSLEGEEHNILQDIRKGNRKGKQEDTVMKSTTEHWRSKGKSVRASKWSEHDGFLCFWDRIYVHSCTTASHPSTMTPEQQDIWDAGRHWSLSPATTGGNRCPITLANM